ncbi:hypothetical protein [Flavobacterium sp. J27]|uniref:hypothetical protein n=1 Tax=Flavobacterium sp. J27 TaxID=2060419 RepID=UPI00103091ED|nr:hypothetical protein [Flavobacterium sp. J27]
MSKVNFYRTTINETNESFSLEGCINAVFQNFGEATVSIDGTELETGESFPIDTAGLPFGPNNNLQIVFKEEQGKNLLFRCVKISKNQCD